MKAYKFIISIFSLWVLCVLPACSNPAPPPTLPPTDISNPPAMTSGQYAVYKTERVFKAPLEPLRFFIQDGNKIVAAMEETDTIKKPIDVVVLSGTWPEINAVRRLKFSDGHYVMERVIENNFPTLFRYQVWNFTARAGQNLDYAVGEQKWTVLEDGRSKLTWTYALRPNARFKRYFVQRFVERDMRPLMDTALDTVKAQADTAFENAFPPVDFK